MLYHQRKKEPHTRTPYSDCLYLETIIIAILERATLYFVGVVDIQNIQGGNIHIRFDPKKNKEQEVLDTLDFQIEALVSIVLPSCEKVTVGFEYQYKESYEGESVLNLFITEIVKLVITDKEIRTCFPLINTTGARATILNRCIQGLENVK